jgi:hypothetical protein
MRATIAIGGGILAIAALAACGSTQAQSQHRTSTRTAAGSRTRQHKTAAATTSELTAVAAADPRCTIHELSLAPPVSDGAMGSIGLRFTFTNTSSAPCSLFGYPGLARLNSARQVMPTTVVRGTSVVVPAEPEKTVVLASGGHASFLAGYSDVPSSPGPCPSSAYLEVTPPNAYDHLTVPLSADVCRKTITVSPVIAGS